jgi:hypothetical protein
MILERLGHERIDAGGPVVCLKEIDHPQAKLVFTSSLYTSEHLRTGSTVAIELTSDPISQLSQPALKIQRLGFRNRDGHHWNQIQQDRSQLNQGQRLWRGTHPFLEREKPPAQGKVNNIVQPRQDSVQLSITK